MRYLLLFIGLLLARPALALPEDDRDYETIKRAAILQTDSHVESVAFSPDQKLLAGGFNGRVTIWNSKLERVVTLTLEDNVRTAPDLATIENDPFNKPAEKERWVLDLAFSPDSKWIAAACSDGTLQQWNVEEAKGTIFSDPNLSKLRSPLLSHEAPATHLAYSPDGTRIISGSDDKTAKLWDAKSATLLFRLQPHPYKISSVAFSQDGKHVTTLGAANRRPYRGDIEIWNVSTGANEKSMTLENMSDSSATLSFDAQIATATVWDFNGLGYLQLWNAVTGEALPRKKFGPRWGRAAFSQYGGIVVIAPAGPRISTVKRPTGGEGRFAQPPGFRITNVFNGAERVQGRDEADYRESLAQTRDIAISRTAGSIAFACNNGTIEIWSVR